MTFTPPNISEQQVAELRQLAALHQQIKSELAKRIIGQEEIIRDLFVTLMAQGHSLMVGVPGLGKTLLVKTLADILDLKFNRIQFTPDLMPSDITGSEIIEESGDGKRDFRFVAGPIFSNLLLADEINRTPPKTQAALLEAMQERHVTVAGKTYPLPSPFFVLATQNPIEQEGTYPLPEAQLDRFMFCLRIDYPTLAEEVDILQRTTIADGAELSKLLDAEQILSLQQAIRAVPVPASVAEFAARLVQTTRPQGEEAPEIVKRYLQWGAGPRASQYLALAGKVLAVLDGRFNVAREDIIQASRLVLRHRLITNYHAEADQITTDEIIDQLVAAAK